MQFNQTEKEADKMFEAANLEVEHADENDDFFKQSKGEDKTASQIYSVDRSRSIFELIEERNQEFEHLENLSEPQRNQFSQQYNELSAKTLEIKVNDKIHVMFNVNDPIFVLAEKIDDDQCEPIQEWSRCNCCGDATQRKLKHCNFCGELSCAKCLYKQRPYPNQMNRSPEEQDQIKPWEQTRGDICIVCNKKFLYRDAMYELMGKLQIRDLHKKSLEKELQKEEYQYDQIVSNLSKVKQERKLQGLQNQKEKKDKMKELEESHFALTAAQNEKEHELKKLKSVEDEQREQKEEAAGSKILG